MEKTIESKRKDRKKRRWKENNTQSYHQSVDLAKFAQMWINVWANLGQGVLISPSLAK
ncbi:hypothetical protein V8050_004123 [Vibrio parahaemolyticus]|nr:hypothetical protein [Vibrio parahaemolyticus]EJG0711405.1 hypothetical protein [Vibrio parahaemolyticus]